MGGLYVGAHHLKCFCSFCCDLLIRKENAPFVPGADMREIESILQNLSASNIHLISAGLSGKSHAIVFVTVSTSSQHTHLDFCYFYSIKTSQNSGTSKAMQKSPFLTEHGATLTFDRQTDGDLMHFVPKSRCFALHR